MNKSKSVIIENSNICKSFFKKNNTDISVSNLSNFNALQQTSQNQSNSILQKNNNLTTIKNFEKDIKDSKSIVNTITIPFTTNLNSLFTALRTFRSEKFFKSADEIYKAMKKKLDKPYTDQYTDPTKIDTELLFYDETLQDEIEKFNYLAITEASGKERAKSDNYFIPFQNESLKNSLLVYHNKIGKVIHEKRQGTLHIERNKNVNDTTNSGTIISYKTLYFLQCILSFFDKQRLQDTYKKGKRKAPDYIDIPESELIQLFTSGPVTPKEKAKISHDFKTFFNELHICIEFWKDCYKYGKLKDIDEIERIKLFSDFQYVSNEKGKTYRVQFNPDFVETFLFTEAKKYAYEKLEIPVLNRDYIIPSLILELANLRRSDKYKCSFTEANIMKVVNNLYPFKQRLEREILIIKDTLEKLENEGLISIQGTEWKLANRDEFKKLSIGINRSIEKKQRNTINYEPDTKTTPEATLETKKQIMQEIGSYILKPEPFRNIVNSLYTDCKDELNNTYNANIYNLEQALVYFKPIFEKSIERAIKQLESE